MTRIAAVLFLVVILIGGGFYVGQRWDSEQEARDKSDTIERLKDAEKSEGDPTDDDAWVRDFVDWLSTD